MGSNTYTQAIKCDPSDAHRPRVVLAEQTTHPFAVHVHHE